MPMTARASGGGLRINFNTKGGRKLQKFLRLAEDTARQKEISARATARVLRRRLIPQLKSRVPNRTGKLANSLRLQETRDNVQLRGVFYARMVRFPKGELNQSVASVAFEIIDKSRREIKAEIRREIRRELSI
ncbi:MAG: hypothetical protein OXE44_19895 [Nitrospinae bacterium]|nr:hypothetical protein [Nitrospinota bacterium]